MKRVVLTSFLVLILSVEGIVASTSSPEQDVSRSSFRDAEGHGRRLWLFSWTSLWGEFIMRIFYVNLHLYPRNKNITACIIKQVSTLVVANNTV